MYLASTKAAEVIADRLSLALDKEDTGYKSDKDSISHLACNLIKWIWNGLSVAMQRLVKVEMKRRGRWGDMADLVDPPRHGEDHVKH